MRNCSCNLEGLGAAVHRRLICSVPLLATIADERDDKRLSIVYICIYRYIYMYRNAEQREDTRIKSSQ